jgi:hypothetical protein
MLSGLRRGSRKALAAVLAATLALALLPAESRSETYSVLHILIEMARPKKPLKPQPACAAPCCPMGVCRGAATMPCCPIVCGCCEPESCQVRWLNRVDKPETCSRGCCENKACCEDCQAVIERQAAMLRRLCAEHDQTMQQLQAMTTELRLEIMGLRQEIQLLRQVFVPPQMQPPYNLIQPPMLPPQQPDPRSMPMPMPYPMPMPQAPFQSNVNYWSLPSSAPMMPSTVVYPLFQSSPQQ